MAHELRTPMHAILGYSDMGSKNTGKLPHEKTAGYFQRIHDSGQRLLRLLDEILDLSRLETGRMVFEFILHDLAATVEDAIDGFRPLFEQHSITAELMPAKFDTVICFDENRIVQVIYNLLSNAIKYTPDGGIITVSFDESQLVPAFGAEDSALIPAVSVSVADQGYGIPEDELELIFAQFVRSSRVGSAAEGAGLGLSISKEIILRHGGRIHASNNAQGGAKFTFTNPRDCEPKPPQNMLRA